MRVCSHSRRAHIRIYTTLFQVPMKLHHLCCKVDAFPLLCSLPQASQCQSAWPEQVLVLDSKQQCRFAAQCSKVYLQYNKPPAEASQQIATSNQSPTTCCAPLLLSRCTWLLAAAIEHRSIQVSQLLASKPAPQTRPLHTSPPSTTASPA
jgi:hypothetical protein